MNHWQYDVHQTYIEQEVIKQCHQGSDCKSGHLSLP
jgi:hypothetical protein